MTAETHIIVELPHGRHIPTQEEIYKRFRLKYTNYKPLMPILFCCAEETERLMYELFAEAREETPKNLIARIRMHKSSKTGNPIKYGYHCPHCGAKGLNLDHRFCHGCSYNLQFYELNIRRNKKREQDWLEDEAA